MDKPLLLIKNKHGKSCGVPPAINNDHSKCYFGYYENVHGEQWIFVYNQETGTAELRGGDAGWERVFKVENGKVNSLILNEGERTWLQNCWETAGGNSR